MDAFFNDILNAILLNKMPLFFEQRITAIPVNRSSYYVLALNRRGFNTIPWNRRLLGILGGQPTSYPAHPSVGDFSVYPVHRGDACWQCGSGGDTLLRCSKCHTALYCDAICQRLDWPAHKGACGGPK